MNDKTKLDVWSQIETLQPHHRVVLLGASNLSRSFDVAINMAMEQLTGPVSFYVAKGHGRSYGLETSCFGKKISGIFSCGLWRSLEEKNDIPTTACLTDIGNDLAYEIAPQQVLEWVAGCVERLESVDAKLVLGDLPIDVLREVGKVRYRAFRTLLFPRCQLSWTEIIARAEQLSDALRQLAEEKKTPIFPGEKSWYQLDPIHPRKRYQWDWWRGFYSCAGWELPSAPRVGLSLARKIFLKILQPEDYAIFGWKCHADQPQGLLRDGTRIALY